MTQTIDEARDTFREALLQFAQRDDGPADFSRIDNWIPEDDDFPDDRELIYSFTFGDEDDATLDAVQRLAQGIPNGHDLFEAAQIYLTSRGESETKGILRTKLSAVSHDQKFLTSMQSIYGGNGTNIPDGFPKEEEFGEWRRVVELEGHETPVKQGASGDCYFIAAVIALKERNELKYEQYGNNWKFEFLEDFLGWN